jgi:tryptophanyl-tRNA synthetase
MLDRKRVLSGMRPTGRLHIGHYFGALQNWTKLQNDPQHQYECFFFIADWHALTSDYADTSAVAQNTVEIAIDWLAAGLDPEKATLFVQSSVPEHAELNLLLSMVAPLGWLERVPTYKEALDNIKDKDLHTYGFLGYPVLQTADIVMYGDPETELIVPVGEDQVSHVELGREIVRHFNLTFGDLDLSHLPPQTLSGAITQMGIFDSAVKQELLSRAYAGDSQYVVSEIRNLYRKSPLQEKGYYAKNLEGNVPAALREPESMLTHTPRIPGLDGRKMSKSYGNAITLSESDADIRAKTRVMTTDPARKRRTDPGNPDVCPAYDWHKLFSPPDTLEWAANGCRTAGIGCIECKSTMAENLIKWIAPIRQRRMDYEQQPDHVLEILDTGSKRARMVAQQTMDRVREAVFHWSDKRAEIARALRASGQVKNIPAGS